MTRCFYWKLFVTMSSSGKHSVKISLMTTTSHAISTLNIVTLTRIYDTGTPLKAYNGPRSKINSSSMFHFEIVRAKQYTYNEVL